MEVAVRFAGLRASERKQKPRKDRASAFGNERRRYGPIRRKKPRR